MTEQKQRIQARVDLEREQALKDFGLEWLIIAELDAKRHREDARNKRGYDYDCNAPGHRAWLNGRYCPCLAKFPANSKDKKRVDICMCDGCRWLRTACVAPGRCSCDRCCNVSVIDHQ